MNKNPYRNSPEYKTKRNEYARKYYQEKYKKKQIAYSAKAKQEMREWYNQLRSTLTCSHCPETDSCCIDFHHVSEKDFGLYDAVNAGFSKNRILKEIAKCVPLCANCHRKLHAGRFTLE